MFLLRKALSGLRGNPMIQNSAIVIALRITGAFLLFVTTLYITRHFDAGLVGQYDLSLSVLAIFGSLCMLGMNQSIIYYSGVFAARDTGQALWGVYKKMLLILWLTAAVFFTLFLFVPKDFINAFFRKDVYGFLLKTFALLGFYALAFFNIDAFRALGRIRVSEVYRSIFRYSFLLGALVFLNFTGRHDNLVDALLFSFALLAVLSTIFVVRYFRSKGVTAGGEFNIRKRDILFRSYPMSVSMICFLLLKSTDIILLGRYVAFEQVAYYARAAQLTLMISIMLHAINTVYAPKIAELYARNDHYTLRHHIKRATQLIFVTTLAPGLVLLLFSDLILGLFGTDYTGASAALKILIAGQAVNAATGFVGMYMNMTDRQQRLQVILIIALVANVALNLLLIPKYGLEGAAIATAVSTAGWNLYGAAWLYYRDRIKMFIH